MKPTKQRPIKFRFWHTNWHQWLKNCAISEAGKVWDLTTNEEIKDVVAVQFTGLLDKNGKEIYEGDILRNGFLTWEVEWLGKGYGYVSVTDGELLDSKFFDLGIEEKHSEVIGNRFENAELLDQK